MCFDTKFLIIFNRCSVGAVFVNLYLSGVCLLHIKQILDDCDLSNVTTSAEQRPEFIQKWYSELQSV